MKYFSSKNRRKTLSEVVKRKIENRQSPFGFLSQGTSAVGQTTLCGSWWIMKAHSFALAFLISSLPISPLAGLFLLGSGLRHRSFLRPASWLMLRHCYRPITAVVMTAFYTYYLCIFSWERQEPKRRKKYKIPFCRSSCHFLVLLLLLLAPLEAMSTFPDHFIQLFLFSFFFTILKRFIIVPFSEKWLETVLLSNSVLDYVCNVCKVRQLRSAFT